MTDLSSVTYCGLYCGLCAARKRIPPAAQALREHMSKEGWPFWGKEIPGFEPFWEFLNGLADNGGKGNCREGGCGPGFCGIRNCARERGVEVCALCDEYPCKRIEGLAKGYVMLIADGQRMREIGLDAWIAEQEKRACTGFCYTDIRCAPYEVPTE